jgi:transposase
MRAKSIPGRVRSIIKSASDKLSGVKKREYIAEVAIEFCDGNARKAERIFGWGRETINKGIRELQTGIKCTDDYSARGNKKTEEKIPQLAEDIRVIVDPKSQADPRFKTLFAYTRITAKAVRQALIDQKSYSDDQLPCENTIGEILNRLGYRLRRVQKAKPLKKIPETDDIFKNVEQANRQADRRVEQREYQLMSRPR